MPDRLLTPEQVIDFLQLDDGCGPELARERLRNRCRARQIPYVKFPGSRLVRFRAADIEKLLQRQTVPAMAQ